MLQMLDNCTTIFQPMPPSHFFIAFLHAFDASCIFPEKLPMRSLPPLFEPA